MPNALLLVAWPEKDAVKTIFAYAGYDSTRSFDENLSSQISAAMSPRTPTLVMPTLPKSLLLSPTPTLH